MSVVSAPRVEEQDGLFNGQKKRPLSIIEENDSDDPDTGTDIIPKVKDDDVTVFDNRVKDAAVKTKPATPATSKTTTTTKSITKSNGVSVRKTTTTVDTKKKPPQFVDTSKAKSLTSDSKPKSPKSKVPMSPDSKIASKILHFSKNARIVPKPDPSSKFPPYVVPKSKSSSSSSSPSKSSSSSSASIKVKNISSGSKSGDRRSSAPISPSCSQSKNSSPETKAEDTANDEEVIRSSMKNIVKRTISMIESSKTSTSPPQSGKSDPPKRRVSKGERPQLPPSSEGNKKSSVDGFQPADSAESEKENVENRTPIKPTVIVTTSPSSPTPSQSQLPSNESSQSELPSNESSKPQIPSNESSKPQIPSNESSKPQIPSNESLQSQIPSNESLQSQILSTESSQSQIPSNESSLSSSSNSSLRLPFTDMEVDFKSNKGNSDEQTSPRVQPGNDSLASITATIRTMTKLTASPPTSRVAFSLRQSPKLGHRSISDTYALSKNNAKPMGAMTFNLLSVPSLVNKGDSGAGTSDSENDDSQNLNGEKSRMRSPFLAPKFHPRRGSYFFKRRMSSESLASLSENDSADNVEDAPPVSASDFNQLKETADRLRLSTRRASVLQWRQQYVESPQPPSFSFKNGLNGDSVDEKLTSERKQKIDEALEWIKNELQEMRSQDQMLARQLLTIRNDIHQIKLRRCTAEHQELLDDFKSELEELQEFSDVLDIPQPIYENNPLKHIGVTRLNISARRFSAC